jgi:HNH endonuclease
MVAPHSAEIPSEPIERSCRPPQVGDYARYRACLRKDFSFRCAYCQSHETEIGSGRAYGGFEIDHFRPKIQFRALRTRYDNLFWSCAECNRAKGDTWPSREEIEKEYRFVDPTREILSDHLELIGLLVVPKTVPGAYTRDAIDLNSPVHQYVRGRRTKAAKVLAAMDARIRALGASPSAAQLIELDTLRRLLLPSQPHDAPTTCLCEEKHPRKK